MYTCLLTVYNIWQETTLFCFQNLFTYNLDEYFYFIDILSSPSKNPKLYSMIQKYVSCQIRKRCLVLKMFVINYWQFTIYQEKLPFQYNIYPWLQNAFFIDTTNNTYNARNAQNPCKHMQFECHTKLFVLKRFFFSNQNQNLI